MDSQLTKEERIEIRVSSKDKKMFKLAQKLSGDKTFSNFIVRIVKNHAEDIIAKNNKILISDRDRQLFFDSVFSDTEPNQNLINAAKRFKSKKT